MNAPLTSKNFSEFHPRVFAFGLALILGGLALTVFGVRTLSSLGFTGVAFMVVGAVILLGQLQPILFLRNLMLADVVLSASSPNVGETIVLRYTQKVRRRVTILSQTLALVFRESATYTSGSDVITVTEDIVVQTVSYNAITLNPKENIQQQWKLQIPPDAMHSFEGKKNSLRWIVQTTITLEGLPAYEDEFIFTVAPECVEE